MDLSLSNKMLCAGAAACTADIISFPLDVAKVRLQLSSNVASIEGSAIVHRGMVGTVFGMIKNEGFQSLYGGISPGLQRQCIFASLRIGLYDPVKGFYTNMLGIDANKQSASSMMFIRIISAISTGAIGISVAQPTDVVKVRMQAQPLKYKNSLQAYSTIFKSEGLAGLWRGLGPNILRNATVNAAELVCYDTVKEAVIRNHIFQDNFFCHFFSAFSAGFCATFVSSPIDVVKTNYMNSTTGQYKSVFHCAQTIAKQGGLFAFYKGFLPSFMRLGTWNVVMFVTFEQLKKLSLQRIEQRSPPPVPPTTNKVIKPASQIPKNSQSPLKPVY